MGPRFSHVTVVVPVEPDWRIVAGVALLKVLRAGATENEMLRFAFDLVAAGRNDELIEKVVREWVHLRRERK